MYVVGMNPYQGLYTKAERLQGKGAAPGIRASIVGASGQTNEFVAIKLAAATWLNGTAVIIDGAAAPGSAVTTASGYPAPTVASRLGVLCFASATATQTMAGTAFGWAQIYGEALAFVSASLSTPGIGLGIGASGQFVGLTTGTATVSAIVVGVALATATAAAGGLTKVFLTYPQFQPFAA